MKVVPPFVGITTMTKKFKIKSNLKPAGDQPEAIKQLVEGLIRLRQSYAGLRRLLFLMLLYEV